MAVSSSRKKLKKKKTKIKKKAKAAAQAKANTVRSAELEEAIREYCELKNKLDAIEGLLNTRKKRIDTLMADLRLTKQVVEGHGQAAFTERRSFQVFNEEKLAALMTKRQLASLASVTADVYDAAKAEGVKIDDAVKVGKTPGLTIKRASSKLARERQKKYITEARKAAEARIEARRAEWRKAAGA